MDLHLLSVLNRVIALAFLQCRQTQDAFWVQLGKRKLWAQAHLSYNFVRKRSMYDWEISKGIVADRIVFEKVPI